MSPSQEEGGSKDPLALVLEVLSKGPHGDAYAYGLVVLNLKTGQTVFERLCVVPQWVAMADASGEPQPFNGLELLQTEGLDIEATIPPAASLPAVESPLIQDFRAILLGDIEAWKKENAVAIATSAIYPRVSNLLRAIERQWYRGLAIGLPVWDVDSMSKTQDTLPVHPILRARDTAYRLRMVEKA